MHINTQSALLSGGIAGTALGSKAAGTVYLGNGVAVDIATILCAALLSLTTETGNHGLLSRRNPHTCGLIPRHSLNPPTLLVLDNPSVRIQKRHKGSIIVVGHQTAIIEINGLILERERGSEGLLPHLHLSISRVHFHLSHRLSHGHGLVDERLVEPVLGLHLTDPAFRARVENILILSPHTQVFQRQRDHGLRCRDSDSDRLSVRRRWALPRLTRLILRIREGNASEAALTYPRTVTDSTQNLGRSHRLGRSRTLCGREHLARGKEYINVLVNICQS
jgi:hypothetical protein